MSTIFDRETLPLIRSSLQSLALSISPASQLDIVPAGSNPLVQEHYDRIVYNIKYGRRGLEVSERERERGCGVIILTSSLTNTTLVRHQRGPKAVTSRAENIKRKEEETFGRKRQWDRLLDLLPGNEEVADVLLSLMRPPLEYDVEGGGGREGFWEEDGEGEGVCERGAKRRRAERSELVFLSPPGLFVATRFGRTCDKKATATSEASHKGGVVHLASSLRCPLFVPLPCTSYLQVCASLSARAS